jgi:phosphatidate cytidylyltransferase
MAMAIREYAAVVDCLPGWTSCLFALVLVLMAWQGWRLGASGVMFVFLPVATADGFAQVVGQLVGRRQLAAKISPSKTIEGTCGGLLAGVMVAILVRNLCGLDIARAAAIGLCAAVAGSGGDLAASWIKRRAGIKDFSNMLPEHGGFLDRFDSLIMALALAGPLLPCES